MTTYPDSEPGSPDPSASAPESERRRLINLAYRMLGSLADAEDVVQETFARWYAMSPDKQREIETPQAWLTTVASRICLDQLGSARARRERYVGEWLPEPVPDRTEWVSGGTGGAAVDPADQVSLDESVSMAFLVVLDSMTPAQRVSFILHEVFRYPFADIAEIVGRTPEACRQLATAARRRVSESRAPMTPGPRQAEIVRDFKQALEAQNIDALVGLLDPGATAIADGGGFVSAARRPIKGGHRVARAFRQFADRSSELQLVERTVNGRPGIVVHHDGVADTVLAFHVVDDRIANIWAVRNPEKLQPWK